MGKITRILYEKASSFDACSRISRKETEKELIDLFFSPQGMEFCGKNNFPSIEDFRHFSKVIINLKEMYMEAVPYPEKE